jgi:spore germination protein YaaH
VEWLDAVVDHTRAALPAEKLSIALYAGGWQWRSGRREQLTASEAVSLAKNLEAMLEWSENADAVHFRVDGAKGGIEVWYEDACSLVRKIERVRRAGVGTVALWHLGKQDPELFSALRAGRCERPPTRP